MKACKLCGTKAVVPSQMIPGLSCCRMCGSFFADSVATDCSQFSIGEILREVVNLSGYRDTLFTHDAIHVVAQLKEVDSQIMNAFHMLIESGSGVTDALMRSTRDSFEEATLGKLCAEAEYSTGLDSALASFAVASYAYALELTDVPVEFNKVHGHDPEAPCIVKFQVEKDHIKSGETTNLEWEVSTPDATVAISDGYRQWSVPAAGTMAVAPSKGRTYTLSAVRSGKACAPKQVKVHVVKPVHINSFRVSKKQVYEGQTISVDWKVSGADRIELYINDGLEYRKIEDVTSLKSKEIRLSRDSQIILTCHNACYQSQQMADVTVKSAPRFPVQQLRCLNRLPKIEIQGPVIPALGRDSMFSGHLAKLQRSQRRLSDDLLKSAGEAFSRIRDKVESRLKSH